MKLLLPITLGALVAVAATTSAFAQCSSGHLSAGLSESLYLSEDQKPEVAMSTYDPANIKLSTDLNKPGQEIVTSE